MKKSKASIIVLLIMAMLLSVVPCGYTSQAAAQNTANSSAKSSIPVTKAITVGNTTMMGTSVNIPPSTFDQNVTLTLKSFKPDLKMQNQHFALLGTPVSVQVEGKDTVRLNQPAVISIIIPSTHLTFIKNRDDLYAAYYNGNSWEYFMPDSVDLKTGLVKFKTYHFSSFGVGTLSEREQFNRFANQMAAQTWAKNTTEKNFMNTTHSYFVETFEKMGISDKTAQGKLLRNIVKENDFGSLMVSFERNNTADIKTKLGEMTGKSLLNLYQVDSSFMGNLTNTVTAASRAAGFLAEGNYIEAQKEIASGMMEFFPIGKIGKAAVEVIDAGISSWKDYEIETAYQTYSKGANKKNGYTVPKGDFDTLTIQMRGALNRINSEAIATHCEANKVKESSLSEKTKNQIKSIALSKLKRQFDSRIKAEGQIQLQKDYHIKVIEAYKRNGLLKRGYHGFDSGMDVEDRLRRLYIVKENIQELIGREIPLDQMCRLISIWYTGYTDKSKNREAFFAELQKLGYAKKPSLVAKPTPAPTPTATPTTKPITSIDTLSPSGSMAIESFGMKMDYSISGGQLTKKLESGSVRSISFEGTAKPGEKITLTIKGVGTNFSSTNKSNKDGASLVYASAQTSTKKLGDAKQDFQAGGNGTCTYSFTVPKDATTVNTWGFLKSNWTNMNGGFSATLAVSVKYTIK